MKIEGHWRWLKYIYFNRQWLQLNLNGRYYHYWSYSFKYQFITNIAFPLEFEKKYTKSINKLYCTYGWILKISQNKVFYSFDFEVPVSQLIFTLLGYICFLQNTSKNICNISFFQLCLYLFHIATHFSSNQYLHQLWLEAAEFQSPNSVHFSVYDPKSWTFSMSTGYYIMLPHSTLVAKSFNSERIKFLFNNYTSRQLAMISSHSCI